MPRQALAIYLALTALLCLATPGHAHRVKLFAYVDGDTIVTESGYSRSSRVNQGTIEVFDAATGALLLTGITDEAGSFAFAVPEPARGGAMALRLKLSAGEGHQAEWTLSADELAATGQPPASEAKPTPAAEAEAVVQPTPENQTPAMPAASQSPQNEAQMEAMIRRELAPIKHMLAELSQTGPGMTEIAGGIGYIVGIFGILAYVKSRARSKDRG
ncbi:hypothetical protein GKC30_02410 [Pseudodesulfovibrio sp. F-1]|uniref:Nickel transport protein n=1 Tax=Pseudodesulfovibrio alkaliphilus TaxID=2661613 RepID=A0A7K1KK80_9BACT|nr:hypothetical protein [Pseudodesulfovibrio alkaliphilus]MUM76483.1 hypothetical protein [Pseudodesulfovibrio alkaliphilus]